jgi:hypothetical protein
MGVKPGELVGRDASQRQPQQLLVRIKELELAQQLLCLTLS